MTSSAFRDDVALLFLSCTRELDYPEVCDEMYARGYAETNEEMQELMAGALSWARSRGWARLWPGDEGQAWSETARGRRATDAWERREGVQR